MKPETTDDCLLSLERAAHAIEVLDDFARRLDLIARSSAVVESVSRLPGIPPLGRQASAGSTDSNQQGRLSLFNEQIDALSHYETTLKRLRAASALVTPAVGSKAVTTTTLLPSAYFDQIAKAAEALTSLGKAIDMLDRSARTAVAAFPFVGDRQVSQSQAGGVRGSAADAVEAGGKFVDHLASVATIYEFFEKRKSISEAAGQLEKFGQAVKGLEVTDKAAEILSSLGKAVGGLEIAGTVTESLSATGAALSALAVPAAALAAFGAGAWAGNKLGSYLEEHYQIQDRLAHPLHPEVYAALAKNEAPYEQVHMAVLAARTLHPFAAAAHPAFNPPKPPPLPPLPRRADSAEAIATTVNFSPTVNIEVRGAEEQRSFVERVKEAMKNALDSFDGELEEKLKRTWERVFARHERSQF